jgi:hypothetical protein
MQEFDSVLNDGIPVLIGLSDDPDDFAEAHSKLNKRLNGVIDKWMPSPIESDIARKKATRLIKDIIDKTGADVRPCKDVDMRRLCIILMKATGGYDGVVPRLDHIIDDTLEHLEDHFSRQEAKDILRSLFCFETTDMSKILDEIGKENNIKHADVLRFLQKYGHGAIARKASNILENMLSTQSVPGKSGAEALKNPVIASRPMNPVIPFRPLRQG